MASVQKSAAQEKNFAERAQPYLQKISILLLHEKNVLDSIQKDPAGSEVKYYELSNSVLNLTAQYISLNNLSLLIFKLKSEEHIEKARKCIYKAIIYMENIVTQYVDAPFSDYAKKLEALPSFSSDERYFFLRKMGLVIDMVKAALGETNRFKWAFVEIEARYAIVVKNCFDLSKAIQNTNPMSPNYESSARHLALIKRLLNDAALQYRDKFELQSKQSGDLVKSQQCFNALRYVHALMGESEAAMALKKQITILENHIITALAAEKKA